MARSGMPGLGQVQHEAVPAFLRKVLERSPHGNVQGVACYYLATSLKRQAQARR